MGTSIVIYHSKYGSTKKYAEWLGEALNCKVFSDSECKKKDLSSYDNIIFGGTIHAGGIMGIDFLTKNHSKIENKNVLAFAVGLNDLDEAGMKDLRDRNFVHSIKNIPCFFCRGAYDPKKIKGPDKIIMKIISNVISKKPSLQVTQNDKDLIKAVLEGCDWTDKKYLDPILKVI